MTRDSNGTQLIIQKKDANFRQEVEDYALKCSEEEGVFFELRTLKQELGTRTNHSKYFENILEKYNGGRYERIRKSVVQNQPRSKVYRSDEMKEFADQITMELEGLFEPSR